MRALTGDEGELEYDELVVAVGGRAAETPLGAIPFGGPQDVPWVPKDRIVLLVAAIFEFGDGVEKYGAHPRPTADDERWNRA